MRVASTFRHALATIGFSIVLVAQSMAAERVTNGDFGSATGWTLWVERGTITGDFNDNTAGDVPTGGAAPVLHFGTADNFNGGYWQAVTLAGGQLYTLSGVTKDTGAANGSATWFEVHIGSSAPVNGVDYGTGVPPTPTIKFDTFGCDNWNGAFSTGCVNSTTSFTAPGASNTVQTVYLLLKVGDGGTTGMIDTSVDKVSLIGPDPCSPPALPSAPVISSPTTSTLNVAINGADSASNFFAIRINGGTFTNQYVQAGGSVGGSPVYQLKATWGVKTVTGLAAATNYTFDVQASVDAGASCVTAFGPSSVGTTSGTLCVVSVPGSGFEGGTGCWSSCNSNPGNPGWTLQPGGSDYCGFARTGTGFAGGELVNHTGTAQAAWYQTIPTIAGHNYRISVWGQIGHPSVCCGIAPKVAEDVLELRVAQGGSAGLTCAAIKDGTFATTTLASKNELNTNSCGSFTELVNTVTATGTSLTLIAFADFDQTGGGGCCYVDTFEIDDWLVNDLSITPPCAGPAAVSAVSRRTHSGTPFDVTIPIAGPAPVESRIATGGTPRVRVTFDGGIAAADGTVDCGSEVVVTNGTCNNASISCSTLVVNLTSNANSCVTVAWSGLVGTGGPPTSGASSVKFRYVLGDTTGDGKVTAADIVKISADAGAVTGSTFRSDLNPNGTVNSVDISLAKSNTRSVAVTCP